jgi:hypothetical protein
MLLPPLYHHNQIVLSRFQNFLEDDVFLIGVLSMDPAKTSVVLLLNEDASNPKIFVDIALIIKTVLLLSQIYAALCLLEDGKRTDRSCVILRDLDVSSLIFILLRSFRLLPKSFGWVDRAVDGVGILVEGIDEN